ncbi:MAG: carbon monoxide dehydrogenase subunit G [Anaerolineales bacterium]|nr:carbon monoxide dehydrogenase subunit G [Anaerolineales bacterium]
MGMEFDGTVHIKSGREKVWAFLIDPEAVSKCVPGVNNLEVIVPDRKFRATVVVGIGSVKSSFVMDVEFSELDPPNRAKLKAHGKAPGSATDVISEMILVENPDGYTELQWSTEVQIMGTIASLAARFAPSITKKLSEEFFSCVRKKLEA